MHSFDVVSRMKPISIYADGRLTIGASGESVAKASDISLCFMAVGSNAAAMAEKELSNLSDRINKYQAHVLDLLDEGRLQTDFDWRADLREFVSLHLIHFQKYWKTHSRCASAGDCLTKGTAMKRNRQRVYIAYERRVKLLAHLKEAIAIIDNQTFSRLPAAKAASVAIIPQVHAINQHAPPWAASQLLKVFRPILRVGLLSSASRSEA